MNDVCIMCGFHEFSRYLVKIDSRVHESSFHENFFEALLMPTKSPTLLALKTDFVAGKKFLIKIRPNRS